MMEKRCYICGSSRHLCGTCPRKHSLPAYNTESDRFCSDFDRRCSMTSSGYHRDIYRDKKKSKANKMQYNAEDRKGNYSSSVSQCSCSGDGDSFNLQNAKRSGKCCRICCKYGHFTRHCWYNDDRTAYNAMSNSDRSSASSSLIENGHSQVDLQLADNVTIKNCTDRTREEDCQQKNSRTERKKSGYYSKNMKLTSDRKKQPNEDCCDGSITDNDSDCSIINKNNRLNNSLSSSLPSNKSSDYSEDELDVGGIIDKDYSSVYPRKVGHKSYKLRSPMQKELHTYKQQVVDYNLESDKDDVLVNANRQTKRENKNRSRHNNIVDSAGDFISERQVSQCSTTISDCIVDRDGTSKYNNKESDSCSDDGNTRNRFDSVEKRRMKCETIAINSKDNTEKSSPLNDRWRNDKRHGSRRSSIERRDRLPYQNIDSKPRRIDREPNYRRNPIRSGRHQNYGKQHLTLYKLSECSDITCYNCGRTGHKSFDCPESGLNRHKLAR